MYTELQNYSSISEDQVAKRAFNTLKRTDTRIPYRKYVRATKVIRDIRKSDTDKALNSHEIDTTQKGVSVTKRLCETKRRNRKQDGRCV